MNIGFFGFSFEQGDGITLKEFADILLQASSQDVQHKFGHYDRLFLLDEKSNPHFYVGLIITIKDQKTFCELRKVGKKLAIKVSELEAGSQLMDFNFFILHKKTFTGIYQHYHNSCSPLQFCYFSKKKFYKPERDARIDAAKGQIKKKEPKLADDEVEKKAKKLFKKNLKYDLVYKKDQFDKIVQEMAEVRGFQYEISSARVAGDGLTPHGVPLTRTSRHVYFEKRKSVREIATALAKFVKDQKITKGKISTIDEDGADRVVDILYNVEGFGEFDFDKIAPQIAVDLDKFADSDLVKKLVAAAKANKVLLGFPNA